LAGCGADVLTLFRSHACVLGGLRVGLERIPLVEGHTVDPSSRVCSYRLMACRVRNRVTGDTVVVQRLAELRDERDLWVVVEQLPVPASVKAEYGTGLPPVAREVKASRRRFG
jgi:hypothetical protein